MKTITKEFTCTISYDLSRLGDPERLLFFDIETTGLSAKRDLVYLIGCVYLKNGVWRLKQWFADSAEAEAELLVHFFLFASRFSVLVHFNGAAFDLPFLKERAALHHTPVPGRIPESLDLYRELRPLKKLLGLADCRQKTLEAFLGTGRKDPYDGGRLIRFYWQYLRTGETALSDALLLHNEEDVKGLPALLSLLSYRDFFSGEFFPESDRLTVAAPARRECSGAPEDPSLPLPARMLLVTCRSAACRLPAPCRFSSEDCLICAGENILSLRIPVFEGTLKYFFENHADYYYLPEEDRAIHKSVATFVDPAHRKKASARTCYQKHAGLFFPVPGDAGEGRPVFYSAYRKNPPFLEYTEGIFLDFDFLHKFLLATLSK